MSSVGVTGTRQSVSGRVEDLLKEIKEVCLRASILNGFIHFASCKTRDSSSSCFK